MMLHLRARGFAVDNEKCNGHTFGPGAKKRPLIVRSYPEAISLSRAKPCIYGIIMEHKMTDYTDL